MHRPNDVVRPTDSLPDSAISDLLYALQAVRDGDFSVRLPGTWTGVDGTIADQNYNIFEL